MIAPHCVNASRLFHSRALLIPWDIPQLAVRGAAQPLGAPAGCLGKQKPLCALFCASHAHFYYLSLPAPGQQGLLYPQSLHSIAEYFSAKFPTAFGEVIHAVCTKERWSIWNFFLILGPYVFVIVCSGSLLEECFDSQGSLFCFRKNSMQNYFKR